MADNPQDEQALSPLVGVEKIRRAMHEGQEYWSVIDVISFINNLRIYHLTTIWQSIKRAWN